MSCKSLKVQNPIFCWLVAVAFMLILDSVPVLAGSTAIGSVAGSTNSTVGGQPLLPNSVIFSGETVRVADGATVIAMSGGKRLVFGRQTEVSLLRDGSEVTVLLGRGDVSVYNAGPDAGLRVKAADLSITPAKGIKTLGEVATLNGAVVVIVEEGSLRVEGYGSPLEVTTGHTVTIRPKMMRAPQTNASGGGGHTQNRLIVAALTAGVVGAILGAIGISRAGTATNAADSASKTAAAAANAAAAAALAAQAATNLVAAVGAASLLETNIVGCELNVLANSQGQPSPYTPPSGFSCR